MPEARRRRIRNLIVSKQGGGNVALMSDASDIVTRGRARDVWKHPEEYNAQAGNRETEVFANIVGMAGESPFAAKLAEHFFPATYRQVMRGLVEIGT